MPAPAPSMADKDKDKKKLKLILKLPRSTSAAPPAAAGAPALPSSRAGPAAAPAALPSSFLSRPAAPAQPHHPPQAPGGPGPASRAAPAPTAASRWSKGYAPPHHAAPGGDKGLAAGSGLRPDPSGAAAGLRTDCGQWNGPGAGFVARTAGSERPSGGSGAGVARGGWSEPDEDDDGTPVKKRKFKTVAESTARSSPAHAKERMAEAEEPGWTKPAGVLPSAPLAASALPPLAKKPALAIKKSESSGESGATEPPISGRHAPDPLPPKQALEGVLDKLQKKDTYGVFAEPVDPRMVPDYYDVIKKPMDFGSIRKKLSKGLYTHVEHFEADIMLICSNAMRYNAPNTVYYKQARAIQDMARKLVPALRHPTSLDGERRLPVKSKSSSGGKKSGKKVPLGKSRFDPAGSDYTSGATLATDGDARGVAAERSGSAGGDDSEAQAGWGGVSQGGTIDTGGTWTQEDSAGMALKPMAMKDGRRPLSTEEYHRSSYKSRNLPAHGQGPVLAAVGGEQQQLFSVGFEHDHAYARSVACFSANLGPAAWNFAAKTIQKVLAPNIAFGPGWVVEPKVLPSSSQLQNGRSQGALFAKVVVAEQHRSPQVGPSLASSKLAQSLSAASSGQFPPAAAPVGVTFDNRNPSNPSVRAVLESLVRSGTASASVTAGGAYDNLKPGVSTLRQGLESAMRAGAMGTAYENLKSATSAGRPATEPVVRQGAEALLRPVTEPVRKQLSESSVRQQATPPTQFSSKSQADVASRSKVFIPPPGFGTFPAAQQGGVVEGQAGFSKQAVQASVAELRNSDLCIDNTVQESSGVSFGQFDLSLDAVADRAAVPLKGLAPVFSKDGLIAAPSSVGKSVEESRGGSKCSSQSRSSSSLDGQASGSTMDGGVSGSDGSVMQPSKDKICKEDSQMSGGMQTTTKQSISSEETGGGTGTLVGPFVHPDDKAIAGRNHSSWVQLQTGPCIADQPASRDRGATAVLATVPGENGFTGHVVPLSMLPTIMGVPTTAGVDEYTLKAWAQAQAQAHAMNLLQHADPKTRAAIQAQLAAGWQPLPVNPNFAPNLQAHYMQQQQQQQQQQQLNGVPFVQPVHPTRTFPATSPNGVLPQIGHVGPVSKAPDTRDVSVTGRHATQSPMGYAGNGRVAQSAVPTMAHNNAPQHSGQLPSGRPDISRNSEVSNPFLGTRPVGSQALPPLQVGNPFSTLSHTPGRVHIPQQQTSSQNSGNANSTTSQHYTQAHSSCSNPGISSRPMPPDLNICFQPPASPTTPKTTSGPKMLVDSQQPDLALQL